MYWIMTIMFVYAGGFITINETPYQFDSPEMCEDYIYENKVEIVQRFIDQPNLTGFEFFCEMEYK